MWVISLEYIAIHSTFFYSLCCSAQLYCQCVLANDFILYGHPRCYHIIRVHTGSFIIEWKYILILVSKQMFDRFPFNPNHRKWKVRKNQCVKSTCHQINDLRYGIPKSVNCSSISFFKQIFFLDQFMLYYYHAFLRKIKIN